MATVVSIAGVVLARPYVSSTFHHHRGGHVALGVHGGLVGQEALTLDEVGDTGHAGHVRLAGERWLATTGGPRIAAGSSLVVPALRGTTPQGWPGGFERIGAPNRADRGSP